jgi:hypothetical protein
MLIALILSFPQIGDKIDPSGKVKEIAQVVLAVCVAVFLVNVGVTALSVPVVGVTLIVVGLAIMAYALWPYFKKNDSAG